MLACPVRGGTRLRPAMQAWAAACQRLAHTMEGIEKTAQAVRSFNNCIGSPPSPFAFRARYELAMIAVQENATVKAEEFLQHNLKLMLKERDSEAHEKSLFALAEIQYKREDWATAAENWEKALAFYPSNA